MSHEERVKTRALMASSQDLERQRGVFYAIDLLPIKMTSVSFQYRNVENLALSEQVAKAMNKHKHKQSVVVPSGKHLEAEDCHGIDHVTLEVAQGTLVALVGLTGEGKTTLLRLLGSVLYPDSGEFFVPGHLRVFHVTQQPVFFHTTLFENLTYGVEKNHTEGSIERVVRICRNLKVQEETINVIRSSEICNWEEKLALTDKVLLHLARALIANPEVLVIHKPTLVFDHAMSVQVMHLLQKFVRDRGLHVEGDHRVRRMRTCIMTASRVEGLKLCDQIFIVRKHGVTTIPASTVTSETIGVGTSSTS